MEATGRGLVCWYFRAGVTWSITGNEEIFSADLLCSYPPVPRKTDPLGSQPPHGCEGERWHMSLAQPPSLSLTHPRTDGPSRSCGIGGPGPAGGTSEATLSFRDHRGHGNGTHAWA